MNQAVYALIHRGENLPLKSTQKQGVTNPKRGEDSLKDISRRNNSLTKRGGEGLFNPRQFPRMTSQSSKRDDQGESP